MNKISKNKIFERFNDMQVIFLATEEKGQPRVRPVTMLYIDDEFWVATGSKDAKTEQLKKNNNVEFCLLLQEEKNSGYIRGAGKCKIIKDKNVKDKMAEKIPYFNDYWETPDDPTFGLLKIELNEIEYLKPGTMIAEKFTL